MKRFITAAACITAMAMPIAVGAQDMEDMSPEAQARYKAASSSEESNESELYINGRRVNAETGNVTTGPDGEVYVRMSPDYDLTPSSEMDEAGMAMSPSEIEEVCRSGNTMAKVGLPCG